jgi:hypothetical protein
VLYRSSGTPLLGLARLRYICCLTGNRGPFTLQGDFGALPFVGRFASFTAKQVINTFCKLVQKSATMVASFISQRQAGALI